MMQFNNIRTFAVILVFAMMLGLPLTAGADVVLDPGYISGTVSAGTYTPYSVYISASGNGYSASKSQLGSTYTLTVQGGDWNYNVYTRAYFRPSGSNYPYTQMYFRNRSFPVPAGTTVTNDYINDSAVVRFHYKINGDQFNSWYGYGYAYKSVSAGEQTNSYGYTNSSYSTPDPTSGYDGIWDMLVIPNSQVRIYTYVYVDGKPYVSPYTYIDINPGDVIDIYFDITHDSSTQQDYGSVDGTIGLNNVDSFIRHDVYGGGDRDYVYSNPGSYLLDSVQTGNHYIRARTYFDDYRTYFYWPYTEGNPSNDLKSIAAGQLITKDFSADAGTLQSNISFNGTLTNEDLYYTYLYAYGIYRIYDPVLGWQYYLPTYGGSAYQYKYYFDTDPGNHRLFLTPGPWDTSRVQAYDYNYDSGYYTYYSLYIVDYNYFNDGYSYDFGQNVVIDPGAVVTQNREYCTGSVNVRFRVAGGGLLSSPSLSGSGNHYREDGKRDLYASLSGYASVYQVEAPMVEVNGPEATYYLTARATTEDGSNVTFGHVDVDLECGVRKGIDLNGPTISVTYPPAGLITNAQVVTVTGTATDESGVASVTVNGNTVADLPSTGNPDDPNEVSFSHDLPVVDGINTITVASVDTVGNESTDSRDIYVDRWMPTASILQPTDTFFSHVDTNIPVEVSASDQGYGFSVVVTLDGNSICEADGPANDAVAETISCTATIAGPLAVGDHVISATVTDAAGNSYTDTKTITTYLAADLTVKPEARHNLTEGTSSIFVTLPDGLTATASLSTNDNREISSGSAITPRDVRYNSGDDKLIQKYDRTADLMGDDYFEVEGTYCPNPENASECYTWRGSDYTKW